MAQGRDTISQRIALDGVDQIKKQLADLGVTGEAAIKQIQTAAAASSSNLNTWSQSIAKAGAYWSAFKKSLDPTTESLKGLSEAVDLVAKRFGVELAGGLAGATAALIEFSSKGAELTHEVEEGAKTLGISTDAFQQLQDSAAASGLSLDEAKNAVAQLTRTIGEAQLAAGGLGTTFGQNGQILRGGVDSATDGVQKLTGGMKSLSDQTQNGVQVLRGMNTEAVKANDAWGHLGITLSQYPATQAGTIKLIQDLSTALDRLTNTNERNAVAQQLLGRSWKTTLPALEDFAKRLQTGTVAAGAFNHEQIELGNAQYRAQAALRLAAQRAEGAIGLVFSPAITAVFNALNQAIAQNSHYFIELGETIAAKVTPVAQDLIKLIQGASDDQIGTKWLLDLKNGIAGVSAEAQKMGPALEIAFGGLVTVLNGIAFVLNAITGSNAFNATAVAIIAVVGRLTGAFTLLGAVLRVALVALGTIITGIAAVVGLPAEIVAAIVGLVAAIAYEVYQNWDAIKAFVLAAWDAIATAASDMAAAINADFQALGTEIADIWNAVLSGVGTVAQAFVDAWNSAVKSVADAFDWLWGWISGVFANIANGISSLIDKIGNLISNIGSAVGLGASGNTAVAGAAGGGLIVGAGSDTSDSIPIRASHGEFMVRAAAVRRYGLDFMYALNAMKLATRGFSMGGLIDGLGAGMVIPRTRFATGGAVAAGPSGQVINLSIFGENLGQLIADDTVAQKITNFANRRQLRSAGRKPSWAGGGRG
jgi:phage-related protein